ncbi:MAG: gliding motility-associated C-terminal domain-containing protein [Bacteroidales bacterium]|jgi:gliding motility-associated-like protein|nr:gliding motility-associated C-terminal domain-containing protein [Bacteroidales bacterium]
MTQTKRLFYILFFLAGSIKGYAQIDAVTFGFSTTAASFEVRCQAQKISAGDTTAFNLSDTADYIFSWSGDTQPFENNLPSASYFFDAAGTYTFTLEVTEKASTTLYSETKTYTILDTLKIPNVFTPNNDGVNDLFIVESNGVIPLEISIFSRTGTLIFKTKAPIIVWDGRNTSGSMVSPGTYYYVLTSEDPAVETQKGFIHVFSDAKQYD